MPLAQAGCADDPSPARRKGVPSRSSGLLVRCAPCIDDMGSSRFGRASRRGRRASVRCKRGTNSRESPTFVQVSMGQAVTYDIDNRAPPRIVRHPGSALPEACRGAPGRCHGSQSRQIPGHPRTSTRPGDSLAELIPEGLLAGRRTTGEQPQPRTRRNRGSSESPGHPGRDRAIHQLLVLGVAGDPAT